MKPYWPLAIQSWGDAERAAAHAVIDSDRQTYGDKVKEFEFYLAGYVGVKYAVMVNSGSSANLLAAAVMRRLAGRSPAGFKNEIIVPAVAWSTTYAPFEQHGYRLVIADIDPKTLNVDIDQVAAACNPRTAGIVGCSILGHPARLDALEQICEERNIFLFEDNCESLGAILGQKRCGSWGDVSTHSFFFSHHLNTTEGGAVLTDLSIIRDMAICMRAHGWARDLPSGNKLVKQVDENALAGGYQFLMPGYNLRPTELAAAVGMVQLSKLPEMNGQRRRNAYNFHVMFDMDQRWQTQEQDPSHYAVPFGFTLVFRHPAQRRIASVAMTNAGIEHRLITGGSFGQHPACDYYDYRFATTAGTPHADHMHNCGLFVGNHAVDLRPQIQRLHEVLDGAITR